MVWMAVLPHFVSVPVRSHGYHSLIALALSSCVSTRKHMSTLCGHELHMCVYLFLHDKTTSLFYSNRTHAHARVHTWISSVVMCKAMYFDHYTPHSPSCARAAHKQVAVAIVKPFTIGMNTIILSSCWRSATPHDLAPLALSAPVGVLAGFVLVTTLPAAVVKGILGTVVLVCVAHPPFIWPQEMATLVWHNLHSHDTASLVQITEFSSC